MNNVLFELCAESIEVAVAGERGGADRVEFCSELGGGGITPRAALMDADFRTFTIPVHVLIRPRQGSFVFSPGEFDLMRRQIEHARRSGASGIAIGALLPDRRIDVERTRELVELARPMAVTFHRAFDETTDLGAALEEVIETGADSLLTSGGAPDVLAGAESVARLRRQAGNRIRIIAGGGLRLETLIETVRRSGVFSVHGSLVRRNPRSTQVGPDLKTLESDVRQAKLLLRNEFRLQNAAVPAL